MDEQTRALTEADVRAIARDEIVSLAGLALRRTQERNYTRSPDTNRVIDLVNEDAAEFWGEVLRDYTKTAEPGA